MKHQNQILTMQKLQKVIKEANCFHRLTEFKNARKVIEWLIYSKYRFKNCYIKLTLAAASRPREMPTRARRSGLSLGHM